MLGKPPYYRVCHLPLSITPNYLSELVSRKQFKQFRHDGASNSLEEDQVLITNLLTNDTIYFSYTDLEKTNSMNSAECNF